MFNVFGHNFKRYDKRRIKSKGCQATKHYQ